MRGGRLRGGVRRVDCGAGAPGRTTDADADAGADADAPLGDAAPAGLLGPGVPAGVGRCAAGGVVASAVPPGAQPSMPPMSRTDRARRTRIGAEPERSTRTGRTLAFLQGRV